MGLLELRLNEFLDAVAAEGRTPGGGSVAAVATAAAAGLLAKVARGSVGWADAAAIAAQADALRARAIPLADDDAEVYKAALRARSESGGESGDRRDFTLGRAFARAAEPPLRIAEVATDVATLAVVVVRNGEPSQRADAATAAALAAAAARAAAELVAVNLTASAGDERVLQAGRLADEAARAAELAFADG